MKTWRVRLHDEAAVREVEMGGGLPGKLEIVPPHEERGVVHAGVTRERSVAAKIDGIPVLPEDALRIGVDDDVEKLRRTPRRAPLAPSDVRHGEPLDQVPAIPFGARKVYTQREGANDDLVLTLAIASWEAERNPGLAASFGYGVSEFAGVRASEPDWIYRWSFRTAAIAASTPFSARIFFT